VFNGEGPRGPQLWVRPLDSSSARPLAGSEGGQYLFWSPDGRSVGFFANGKLKRTEIDGGQPQSLADVLTPAGGTWNADGTILYVPASRGNTFRVSATGGGSSQLAPRRTPRLATMLPQFLPNGRQFLFFAVRADESGEVYVGDLENDDVHRALSADAPASYGLGHLWFVRGRTLSAQRFDPLTLGLSGPVLPDVRAHGSWREPVWHWDTRSTLQDASCASLHDFASAVCRHLERAALSDDHNRERTCATDYGAVELAADCAALTFPHSRRPFDFVGTCLGVETLKGRERERPAREDGRSRCF
jgi:hypothetical protein